MHLCCYSLQQHIFLVFCNDFDTQSHMFPFIFRNKILLFPKWCQKPTYPILGYSSVVNIEKGNFTNIGNSYKTKKIATIIIFFCSCGDQEKKEIYVSEKNILGLVAL